MGVTQALPLTGKTIYQKLYTKNQTKTMILPKIYSYLNNHLFQTHLQVMLWRVADQQVPHDFDGFARSVLLFQALQIMTQANLNLSMG